MESSIQPYAFDNADPAAGQMLGYLSTILDPHTRGRLLKLATYGKRCLELGAGNGSMATWMANRVGTQGVVVATDIDTRHIKDHPQVRIMKHDLVADELPDGPFDVIHARLLLAHLPARVEIVARLVDRLDDGGTLVVEDWGTWSGPLLACDQPDAKQVYTRYQEALLAVFDTAGNDPGWATLAATAMRLAGLTCIDAAGEAISWRGGTAGCLLPTVVATQLRGPLLAAGLSPDDLRRLPEIMTDPSTLIMEDLMISTIGHRVP